MQPCRGGSYSSATNLTDASECTAATPGHFAATGSTEQTACREGSFANGTRNDACELCPEGYYQDQPAAAACVRCAAGKFCPVGSSRELDAQCEAGTYARLTDRSGDPECLDCPAGSSCGGGAAPPSECSPGSFAATAGLSECASCAGGTYQGESNATSCLPCVEGSYCAEGASAPLPCVAGSYSTATNLTAAGECTDASPGHFATTGSTQQTACAKGSYTDAYVFFWQGLV